MEGKTDIYFSEHRILDKNGTYKWILARGKIISRNEDETPKRLIGTHADITERKQAEKALSKNRDELIRAEEVALFGNWEFDLNAGIVRTSRGARRIYGLDLTDRVYTIKKIQEIPMPEYREMLDMAIRNLIENNIPYGVEFKIKRCNDGTVIDVYSKAEFDQTKNVVFGILQDITERKQAEKKIHELNRDLEWRVHQRTNQLKEANKELEDFVYSVSHDLRAPLRSISGFAEIIERRHKASLNEEGRHYFDNIVKASQQMGELIDDLLKFSRLGRKAINLETVSLDEVFQTAIKTLSDPIKAAGARINIPVHMPAVQGDFTLVVHIFINLLENAVKYHKPNVPPLIDIGVEVEDQSIVVSISDNGIGIEPAYHEKIFNIFQRLHSQADYPGTGIGLAAVKKALQIMGSEIRVESKPGKGSVFKVKMTTTVESEQVQQ